MRRRKVYDEKTGTYIYVDALTGAGIIDTIKNMAGKFATQALKSGSKKAEEELGKYAVEKIIPRGPAIMKSMNEIKPNKSLNEVKPNEVKPNKSSPDEDIHNRINKLVSIKRKKPMTII